MKLLLTGPSGNLGGAIIKHCSDDIFKVGRDNWQSLDDMLAQGIDVVIHAAYDLKSRLSESPSHIMGSNLMATVRLVEAMQKHRTPRLIFISTCAVYGESMKTNEETQCCPISINGIVKLLNEKIIAEYCSNNKIIYEIYRVFNTFGGKDEFSILAHLRRSLENGHEFQLNNCGLSQRDFIHVEDVANIILRLIKTKHSFTHLNIGTGVSTRISEIVDMVKRKYPELKVNNNKIQEAEYSRADITRLQSLVDYEFINVLKYLEDEFI